MKNKAFYTAISYWFLMLGFVLFLSGCKTKKTIIDKKEIETEEVVIDEKKTEEKKQSETEKEKKEEKLIIDEDTEIEADKIVITDPDGKVTEIIKPKIKKRKSENKESVTDKEKVTETEEDMQRERKEVVKKEKKSDVSEKHTSKGKEPFWLCIIGCCIVFGLAYYVFRKLRII